MKLLDKIKKTCRDKSPLANQEVSVSEWGVTVHVRSLSAKSRLSLAALTQGGAVNPDYTKMFALVGSECLRDSTGAKIFDTPADVLENLDCFGEEFDRLIKLAFEVSGFNAEDTEKAAFQGFTSGTGG